MLSLILKGTKCSRDSHCWYSWHQLSNILVVALFPGGVSGKEPTCQCRRPKRQETWVRSLGQEDPLEKEMTTHSSILAWRIPGTGEPGGMPSMGSHRVSHCHCQCHCLLLIFIYNWSTQNEKQLVASVSTGL